MFLAAFRYAIRFVGNIAVSRSVDHGIAAPIKDAIVVNALLLALIRDAAQCGGAAGV